MKIAFIGLGAMGFPMARHLAKEHDVLVWNRTREKAEKHAAEEGSRLANDLAECATAEVIVTILPTSKEVDEIVDRLLPHVQPGTLWIDATSGDPNVSRLTAQRLAEKGVEFVDAPVTGAVVGATNATLTIMIGGSAEAFARAKEILRLNGKTLIHVGPVGSGHAIKVLTNSI
ncbi:MAG TPA: NAD(P)-dependent oxidoreductase, partial [Thermoanaerobaculia bacterium]|nr:NAD(P)-dependent oxidoreductase [Thermoanaerobaculia bacterium]